MSSKGSDRLGKVYSVIRFGAWAVLFAVGGVAGLVSHSGALPVLASFLLATVFALAMIRPWMGTAAQPGVASASSTLKKCPYCAESIQREAVVCRYCNRDLEPVSDLPGNERTQSQDSAALSLPDPDVTAETTMSPLPSETSVRRAKLMLYVLLAAQVLVVAFSTSLPIMWLWIPLGVPVYLLHNSLFIALEFPAFLAATILLARQVRPASGDVLLRRAWMIWLPVNVLGVLCTLNSQFVVVYMLFDLTRQVGTFLLLAQVASTILLIKAVAKTGSTRSEHAEGSEEWPERRSA